MLKRLRDGSIDMSLDVTSEPEPEPAEEADNFFSDSHNDDFIQRWKSTQQTLFTRTAEQSREADSVKYSNRKLSFSRKKDEAIRRHSFPVKTSLECGT
ncbi:hypothetical protein EB796_013024 [Bugula neritina]|uniref:Uncharacterized protein n=1 Tax=Bugula neritina TaxID=10212 RepID=A0A7J7JSM2_BUGNE|nr:hypothetical protein EB796_013024 [Bugula neritina]